MGTRYTFITEILDNERDAERIVNLENILSKEAELQPHHFKFQKLDFGKWVAFCGLNKNLGGGFYEWAKFDSDVRVVWIDDEGSNGTY